MSERECLSIIYQYEFEVTGNQLSASQTLEVWKYSFPEEFQPANSLAYIYNVLGDFERAVEEAKEAVQTKPDSRLSVFQSGPCLSRTWED